jgi:hypothetical protein
MNSLEKYIEKLDCFEKEPMAALLEAEIVEQRWAQNVPDEKCDVAVTWLIAHENNWKSK